MVMAATSFSEAKAEFDKTFSGPYIICRKTCRAKTLGSVELCRIFPIMRLRANSKAV